MNNHPVLITRSNQSKLILKVESSVLRVSAPLHVSDEQIYEFITSKRDWIEHHLNKLKQKNIQEHILGKSDWEYELSADESFSYCLIKHVISIPSSWQTCSSKKVIINRIRHELVKILFKKSVSEIEDRLNQSKPTGLKIKPLSNAWGYCTSSRNIVLDPMVAALPMHLANYIICHECAHLVHMDHSQQFWAFCDTLSPGARHLDRELSGYCKK